jgi:hypothetical protein
MPQNDFNHSEADFDFIAMGFMQLQSNEYTIITHQFPLLDIWGNLPVKAV